MSEGRFAELLGELDGTRDNDISRATSPGGDPSNQENRKTARNRPRTFAYFRCLPYEVEDNAVVQGHLSEILKNLYISIEAGDFAPGAIHRTRELRSWLGLKFDLPKEQRIRLVKLYYELSLAPGIDATVSERFASMFMVLTKYVSYNSPSCCKY